MEEHKTTVARCGPETFAGSLRTSRSNGRKISDIIGDICDESLKKIMDRQAIAIIEIIKRIDNDKIHRFKISDTIQCGFKGIDRSGKENPFCATYINDDRHHDDNEWSEYGKGLIDGLKACCDEAIIITRYEKKNGGYAFEKCVFDFQKMGLENIHSPECTSITEEFYRENHPYSMGSSIICNNLLPNIFKGNYHDLVNDIKNILITKYSSSLLEGNIDCPEKSRLKYKYSKNNKIIEEFIKPIPSYIEDVNHPYQKFTTIMDVRENDKGETTIFVKRNWIDKWYYYSKDNNKYKAFLSKAKYESKLQEYSNKLGEFIMIGTRTSGVEQKNDKNEYILPKSSIVMKRHERPLTISIHNGGRHMSFIKCANEHNHHYFELSWKKKILTKLIENNNRKIIDCDLTRINKKMMEAGKWCQLAIRTKIQTETNFKKEWLKKHGIEWNINKSYSENIEFANNHAASTIQKAVRMCQSYSKFHQIKDNVIKIQSLMRKYIVSKKYKMMLSNVSKTISSSGGSDVSDTGSLSGGSDVSDTGSLSGESDVSDTGSLSGESDVSETESISGGSNVMEDEDVLNGNVNASDDDSAGDDDEEKQCANINPNDHIPPQVRRSETSSSIGNPLKITIELLDSLKNKDLSDEEDTIARFGVPSPNTKGLRSIYNELLEKQFLPNQLVLIKKLAYYEYYSYKQWIHDIKIMLNSIYGERDDESKLPVCGGSDISKIVTLVTRMNNNRTNHPTNSTIV